MNEVGAGTLCQLLLQTEPSNSTEKKVNMYNMDTGDDHIERKWTDRCKTHGQIHRWTDSETDGQTCLHKHGQTDGWADRRMNETNRWTGDKWRQTEITVEKKHVLGAHATQHLV